MNAEEILNRKHQANHNNDEVSVKDSWNPFSLRIVLEAMEEYAEQKQNQELSDLRAELTAEKDKVEMLRFELKASDHALAEERATSKRYRECCESEGREIAHLLTAIKSIEENNSKLVEALMELKKESYDLMDFCVDRKYIDPEDETDGLISFNKAMDKATEALKDYNQI